MSPTKGELKCLTRSFWSSLKVIPSVLTISRAMRKMRIFFIVYIIRVAYAIVNQLTLHMKVQIQKNNQEESITSNQVSIEQQKSTASALSSVPIESMDWIIQPDSTNRRGLALSNYTFVKNNYQLTKHNFGAVISVFGESELELEGNINHFRILVGDSPNQNIKCFFDSSYKFIVENLKHTNVVVHCKAGVSRSATIVAAYLMKHDNIGYSQAIKLLQKKRSIVDPNKGFRKQLREYGIQLKQQREKCLIY